MKNKRNRLVCAIAVLLLAVVGRILWINFNTISFPQADFPIGQWVPLEGDFFYSSAEDTKGYAVRVSSAEAMTYESFMNRFGKSLDYLGEESRHDVIVLKVEFQNQDNLQGGVFIRDFNLVNAAQSQYFNPSSNYMAIANPDFDPYAEGVKVQPGTEASLYFVYDTVARADKITYLDQQKGKESLSMYLNISLYPVHKMVKMEISLNGLDE